MPCKAAESVPWKKYTQIASKAQWTKTLRQKNGRLLGALVCAAALLSLLTFLKGLQYLLSSWDLDYQFWQGNCARKRNKKFKWWTNREGFSDLYNRSIVFGKSLYDTKHPWKRCRWQTSIPVIQKLKICDHGIKENSIWGSQIKAEWYGCFGAWWVF